MIKPIARRDKSYRGPGIEEGLRILGEVKKTIKVPVLTDVHEDTRQSKKWLMWWMYCKHRLFYAVKQILSNVLHAKNSGEY